MDEQELELRVRTCLRPTNVPSVNETWRRFERGLDRHEPPRLGSGLRIGLAFAFLLLSAGLAAGATAEGRQILVSVASKIVSAGYVRSLEPAPNFVVLQPRVIPQGMLLISETYRPNSASNKRADGASTEDAAAPVPITTARRIRGEVISPELGNAAESRARELLVQVQRPVLVLIYGDTDNHLLELVEQPALDSRLPDGESGTIRDDRAVFEHRGDHDILTWIEQGTLVQIGTTAGRAEMVEFAQQLLATPLEDYVNGHPAVDSTPRAVLTPPAQASSSVSMQLGIRENPHATREEIVQQCGWNEKLATEPEGLFPPQTRCAAGLVSGRGKEVANWSFDRVLWSQAAARLGVGVSTGPAADRLVYLIEVEVTVTGGTVIVIDASTGEPYLLGELQAG